jgi:preprotein translocase subunit SecA
VLIAFCQVHDKNHVQEMGTVAIHLSKWQVEGIDPQMGDEKKLRSLWELLQKRPGLKLTLQKRRREIRAIGREIVCMGQGGEKKKPLPKLKTGRNDPCPCGSGKKYKKCCLDKKL